MESIKYITKVDDDGQIKDFPSLQELKGQEVEVIILPHINKKEMKLRHQILRHKIKVKGKPLSQYVIEERELSR
ncbi:MAG: hypothetical protein AB1798_07840 [Spirochaetota bacterium]